MSWQSCLSLSCLEGLRKDDHTVRADADKSSKWHFIPAFTFSLGLIAWVIRKARVIAAPVAVESYLPVRLPYTPFLNDTNTLSIRFLIEH
jgi:hypothetical protein